MAKSDDILKKYGVSQVRGSDGSRTTKKTNDAKTPETGTSKADDILAKYGVTQARGNKNDATVKLRTQQENERRARMSEHDSLLKELDEVELGIQAAFWPGEAKRLATRESEILARLDELDAELGNPKQYYTKSDKVGAFFSGNAKQYGSGMVNTAGTYLEADAQLGGKLTNVLNAALSSAFYGTPGVYTPAEYTLQDKEQLNELSGNLQQKADTMSDESAQELEGVKQGMGKVGQFAVDAGGQVLQMGADWALGGFGSASLVPMAIRTFGGKAQEARQSGATLDQQIQSGMASAAVEVLTEKLGDGLAGVYGKGAMDDVTKALVNKMTSNEMGRTALSALAGMLEEGGEELISALADPIISAIYTDGGLQETAKQYGTAEFWADTFYDALIGTAMGSLGGGVELINTAGSNANVKQTYGPSSQDLVTEALEINKDNSYAKKMQGRLDRGRSLTGNQLATLLNQNNDTMTAQDLAVIAKAAEERLTELGETGDVKTIAAALAKETAGESLSKAESKVVAQSKFGQQVANELKPENINSGNYDTGWVERIGTQKINAEEYSRLVEAAQSQQEGENTPTAQVPSETQNAEQTAQETAKEVAVPTVAKNATTETASETLSAAQIDHVTTLEEASKKYGSQAKAMVHTYHQGQDVARYDRAYQAAYDMGRSGVSENYAISSESASYLTENQRKLAYAAGKDSSDSAAKALDTENKKAANGKAVRKEGVVKGEGVSTKDLKEAFNDTQGKAYRILSTIAKVTGIDIVLYKSQKNAEGDFVGEQGRFNRDDPGTIYIDLNAGLENVKSADDLKKYVMLRTFSHEFTHFIEKWNPVRYNEFRRVVFDTLEERLENVHDLIEIKQESNGLSYEMASREVVAEAMTDILPDSRFLENLEQKHQSIFQQLIQKFKEFVSEVRSYFNSIYANDSREANALKEQVGDTLKYLDSIVELFDQIAVEAVETYQSTVAGEEVAVDEVDTTTETEAETVAETAPVEAETEQVHEEADQTERKPEQNSKPYSITDGTKPGYVEIRFDGKPEQRILDAVKSVHFRWSKTNKTWYGKASRESVAEVLDAAYQTAVKPTSEDKKQPTDFETAFHNASQEERDEVVAEMDENMGKPSHMYPTEIYETNPISNNEEVTSNGEEQNAAAVLSTDGSGAGNVQLLEEVETRDVPRDGAGGDTVADASERGRAAGRSGDRDDAQRGIGGHGTGSGEIGDLRGSDRVTENKAQKLHEEVLQQIQQKSTEKPKGSNFVIGDSLNLPNGEKARYKANVDAIRLVKQLEAENRYATQEEQVILSKYVGWGGLANVFSDKKADWTREYQELKQLLTDEEYTSARGSTLNAHYTDISVIKAMYDGLKQLGFTGGRMMEPSSGVGNFVGAMPTDMSENVRSWTMVELDGITGLIAKYLYPNADVRIQGFEKTNIPNNYMDVAIGNVPFGNYSIADKTYPKKVTSAIHNYFFAKSLDKVRPGGIVMFITSSYTMNSKDNTVRRYIMQKSDLLGAIRLPDSAFKGNAGTEVVTDILILKRRADNTNYSGEDFLEAPYTYPVQGSYRGAYINSYFADHPEMVLGTAAMSGSMYRSDSLTYKALEGKGSLADQIREAFSHIQGKMDYPAQLSPEKTNFAVERASKKVKNNGYVSKDGKIYQNLNGELQEVNTSKSIAERITGMLEIRDAAKTLQNYQQQGLKDSEIRKARQKLNKAYDAFVKKFGYINAPANRKAINGDPDRFSIYALENYNPETKKATKSDIFTKNTIAPNRTVTSAKDAAEGLIVSVNQTGGVDTSLISKLTGKPESDVIRELIDSRHVFKNRDGNLETAEVYLSGNVRAKLRDAEALIPMDADYKKNVEALRAIVPADVGYQDIFVNPGTPWIPDSVYSDFAAHMLGSQNTEWRKAVEVVRNADTGNFTVELKTKYLKSNSYNTQRWGTNRRSFLDLFDAMLNSKSVVVKYKTDDGKSVVDQDATAAANEKVEAIQKEFQEWLWQDENRRTDLSTLYNETFNSMVTPKYNGDNLTVNGANAMKPLRPHQRDAVQRVISSGGNTLLAHKVGAGKTYEMAASAMKLKQLGLVKKPMFAVPKSLVAQWGNEFMDFFPTAKLLVAEASDFTAANRKIFANRIANGDYDAVIVSYEQFEKLPISAEFARELYQEQIDSVIRAIEEAKAEKGGKSLSVKDLEKKRKQLQTKIDKLTDTAKDEDNIEFEQLGVDSLFIDEAHNFKNLFYTTSMTNVSGLGDKDGSKRAFDLYTKTRYLQKLNGGRGIVFATATPVMNSMSEMYIMQKYLQPDLLDQLGLSTFDAWAKQFGEVVNGVEIKPSGQGYRVKQSFSRFKNMNELQLLFRNFADVLTDIPGLKIPKMKGGKVNVVVCDPGQFQQDYMKNLEKRADNIKNVDPSVDNMLKITSDGRKISYTQRMIDPSLPYEEGCKIFRCADNVIRKYKESQGIKGTQIVFCDMATPKGKSSGSAAEAEDAGTDMESAKLYDDMKARMIKGGIPAKEIAFIHEADSDAKKKKLFADVNDGKIRVLIGSTGKMGVGMNAQKRIVAIHHLDAPWRPGDVEQRNGRAYRQGNINEEVENFTYVTEGSFDARLWDILDRKQRFIDQIMNGENVGREVEDTGEVTLSAAEVKALASGSPLIMEQVQMDTDIKKLESLYRSHHSAVANARIRLEQDKGVIATNQKFAEEGKKDLAARVDTYSDGKFSITIGKQKYTDKKDAGIALMAAATAKATEDGYTTIGKFAGFDLRVVKTAEGVKGQIRGNQNYSFNTYPGNTTYMISHLISKVEAMDDAVKLWEQKVSDAKQDMAEQEKLINQPFAKQAELDQKRSRYREVMDILNPKEEQTLDTMDESSDNVQYQSRKKEIEEQTNDRAGKQRSDISGFSGYGQHQGTIQKLIGRQGVDGKPEGRNDSGGKGKSPFKDLGAAERRRLIVAVKESVYNGDNFDEARQFVAGFYGKSALDMNRNDWDAAYENITEKLYDDIQELHPVLVETKYSYLTSNVAGLVNSLKQKDQHQQRREVLSDREVLAAAASELMAADLTEGERDALRIFQSRLAKLEDLQTQRAEQGRLYKDQQFGTKVDREAAAKTLARMKILDNQIERAKEDVLSVENKQVLKSVLQKARKIVEKQQWTKDQDTLKRWRDRRNNAAAIKKYRDRLTKDVNDLTNWVLHPSNKDAVKHIPEVLRDSVIPFLTSIDFTSKQQLRGGAATKADEAFINRLNGLKAALKPNTNANELYADYSDLPPNFTERLQTLIDAAQAIVNQKSGEFVVNQMTSEELRELSQVVRTLKEFVKNFNRFHVNAMFQHVYEAGDSTIDTLSQMGNASAYTGSVSNFVLWQQMRPAYAWERFGEGGKAIYDAFRKGQATLAFNTRKIVDFAEGAYTAQEAKVWESEIKEIEIEDGTIKMPVSTIMSFYELSKRPQALEHILGNGIRVATFKNGIQKISDAGHLLTLEDVYTIIDALTDRQKEVADKLQKFMQEQGGKWGNYVSIKRFGEKLFGEEHYFPINSDGRYLAATAEEHPRAASLYALLNMGFTKPLQKGANNRIVLYSIFDVFSNHMASMAQYNALSLPVVDAIKWFNYQQKSEADESGKRVVTGSVRDQMDRVYGVPEESRPGSGRQGYAQSFVINILKAFNGTEAQGVPADVTGLNTLRRYNMAQVAYNFRVVVQQPLAITRAALLIDYESIMRGMKLRPAVIKKNIQEMKQYSGIAAWKSLGFYDTNISRGLTEIIKHSDTPMDKVREAGMLGAEKADELTWAGIWSACKEEVIRKQGLKPADGKVFYDAVTDLFEDVVYKTQVVDSVLTKNEYMRSKGFFARAVGSFMSEPTTTASMLVDAFDKYHTDISRGMTKQQAWKKNGKYIGRVAYVYGVGAVVLAAVQAVADAFRDDDDYQTFGEKWLEAFGGNLVDELMPFNKLPILSDFYELSKELLSIFGVDTYGNPPQSVFMQWYDSLIKGVEILNDRISGKDTNYTWYGGIYKMLQAVSGMTGLPMAAATREIVTAWNNIIGAMAPSLKVKTYDSGEKNEIKYAFQDGWLTYDEAKEALLGKGLVDNENEAYWTMEGWEAGEGYSRYDAIYDAVRNGISINESMKELTSHGYTEKEVLSQVKGQIGTWYQDGEITKQQAVNMMTKYFDMDSEEITATVNRWSSKVVTGIAYGDIKDEYLIGNITASRAVDMLVRYGGKSKEKATADVEYWRFTRDYPDIYAEDSWFDKYYKDISNSGMDIGIYMDYRNKVKGIDGDGKKQRRMEVIDSLPISNAQKDALYFSEGWAESRIYEAPWH